MTLKEPQQPEGDWTPAIEEVVAKANELLAPELQEPEVTEKSATPADKPEEGKPPEEADRTGGEATPTPPGKPEDQVILVDGERLTLDEIREFKQGGLRQSDYTRKTQALAEERREYEESRREGESTTTQLLDQNRRLIGMLNPQNPGEEPEVAAAAKPPDDERYREVTERQDRLEKQIQDREVATSEADRNEFIRDTFDATTRGLFDEFKVPEKEQALYKSALLGSGLTAEDPATGELSEASVSKTVRRTFLKLRDQANTQVTEQVRETLDSFKKEPKQAPVQVPPEKPPTEHLSPADELRRGKRDPWDSQENTREYMERLRESTAPRD